MIIRTEYLLFGLPIMGELLISVDGHSNHWMLANRLWASLIRWIRWVWERTEWTVSWEFSSRSDSIQFNSYSSVQWRDLMWRVCMISLATWWITSANPIQKVKLCSHHQRFDVNMLIQQLEGTLSSRTLFHGFKQWGYLVGVLLKLSGKLIIFHWMSLQYFKSLKYA